MPRGRARISTTDGVNVHYGENNVNAGRLRELPEISVDHFHGDSLKASAFFLSHGHTDHMVGMEGAAFLRRLNEPGVFLYTHGITPILLTAFERYLGGVKGQDDLLRRKKLVPLVTLVPYIMSMNSIQDGIEVIKTVQVTLLPAQHCPGSVMFLFETDSLCILHTGDFRTAVSELQTIEALHIPPTIVGKEEEWRLKTIDHLYIDTTFCTRAFGATFPCRKEVITKAMTHIKNWIQDFRSDGNWIFIKFAAKFAHEHLLVKLHSTLKMKVHVSKQRQAIYKHVPAIYEATTLDRYSTPLHFCEDRNCLEGNHLEMKLSCMWYTIRSNNEAAAAAVRGGRGRGRGRTMRGAASSRVIPKITCDTVVRTPKRLSVCYAMHPSLQEVVNTIEFLKPKIVTPLVMPFASTLQDIKEAFRQYCSHSFLYQDYRTPNEIINPPRKRAGKSNLLLETSNLSALGLLAYKKWQEDIDPDATSSDSDESETEEIAPAVIQFKRDPIEDIQKVNPKYLFESFESPEKDEEEEEAVSQPVKFRGISRKIILMDSPSPIRSPENSQSEPNSPSFSFQMSNPINSSPDVENDNEGSEVKRLKLCKSPQKSCTSSSVVRKLDFDSYPNVPGHSRNTSNIMMLPIAETPPSKSTSLPTTNIEIITIEDADSDTDFEVESNSSNSQTLFSFD